MIYRIPFSFAINTVLILLNLFNIFHVLILSRVIPYDIVWGGNLGDPSQMQRLELISLTINIFITLVIAIKGNYIRLKVPGKIINILIWLFVLLFSLNTIANLLAKTNIERFVFSPVTLIIAILCFRIVMEKETSKA